jgi:hypothetical protein
MDVLGALGKLVPKKTIGKLYDDALSGPAKEAGKLGTDVVNAYRSSSQSLAGCRSLHAASLCRVGRKGAPIDI